MIKHDYEEKLSGYLWQIDYYEKETTFLAYLCMYVIIFFNFYQVRSGIG